MRLIAVGGSMTTRPGGISFEVDFSSKEEARRNNDRPETAAWAEGLQQLVGGQPSYQNLRQVYRTE